MNYYTYANGRWEKFYNYTQLINWLSQYNRDWACEDYNSFLECTGVTDNDIRYGTMQYGMRRRIIGDEEFIYPYYKTVAIPRDHHIYQEDFISVYCEKLKNEVRAWRYVDSIDHERRVRLKEDKEWEAMRSRFYVPRRRKHYRWMEYNGGFHHCGHYAPGAPMRDRRAAADPEQKPFIRASRNLNNLPDRWDDKWNRSPCNWKKQGKYRHQWEHGVTTRSKHEYSYNLYVSTQGELNSSP